jgi:uncharacterized membrane protein YgdD (TMEM256/DUF423 family)
MHQRIIKIGALLAAFSVALGAFGAHGLKKLVEPEAVSTFETGVRYQMYHAFALLIAGILYRHYPVRTLRMSVWSFLLGIVFFSGSLYLLTALKATQTVGLSGIGMITPIGGVFLIIGWLLLLVSVGKRV